MGVSSYERVIVIENLKVTFYRKFDDVIDDKFKRLMKSHNRNLIHLAIFLFTTFIVAITIASKGEMINGVNTNAKWVYLTFAISASYVIINPLINPLMLMRNHRRIKEERHKTINQLLEIVRDNSKINFHYEGANKIPENIINLIKSEIFTNYENKKKFEIKHLHTLSGSFNSEEVDIYNYNSYYTRKVEKEKSSRETIFNGSLYITNLPIDKDFYYKAVPNHFNYKGNESHTKVLGVDITKAVLGRKDSEEIVSSTNQQGSQEYFIDTNDEHLANKVITEDIKNMFFQFNLTGGFKDLKGSINEHEGIKEGFANWVEDLKEFNAKDRIEALLIKDGKLYVFFEFKDDTGKRNEPFGAVSLSDIDSVWIDIQDIYERGNIISRVARNAYEVES